MVASCSAMNCRNRHRKSVKMKFHRIPKDPNMRKLWLDSIGRVNFTPSTSTVICEKHFTSEDYELNVHGNKVLKKTAVPTVFDFFAHVKKKPEQRRILKEESTSQEADQKLNTCKARCKVSEQVENKNFLEAGPPCLSNKPISSFEESTSEGADQELNICEVSEVVKSKNFVPAVPSNLSNKPISSFEDSTLEGADQTLNISEVGEMVEMKNSSNGTLVKNICNSRILRTRRQPVFFGDFEFSDLNDEQRRKRFWKVAHETVHKYKTVNSSNQRKIRRQRDRIISLENKLKELRKQKIISSAQAFVLQEDF